MLPPSFVFIVLVLYKCSYITCVLRRLQQGFSLPNHPPSSMLPPTVDKVLPSEPIFCRLCKHFPIEENRHFIPHFPKNREDGVLCQQTIPREIQKNHPSFIRISHRFPKWG